MGLSFLEGAVDAYGCRFAVSPPSHWIWGPDPFLLESVYSSCFLWSLLAAGLASSWAWLACTQAPLLFTCGAGFPLSRWFPSLSFPPTHATWPFFPPISSENIVSLPTSSLNNVAFQGLGAGITVSAEYAECGGVWNELPFSTQCKMQICQLPFSSLGLDFPKGLPLQVTACPANC